MDCRRRILIAAMWLAGIFSLFCALSLFTGLILIGLAPADLTLNAPEARTLILLLSSLLMIPRRLDPMLSHPMRRASRKREAW